jgi:hypothetical protein
MLLFQLVLVAMVSLSVGAFLWAADRRRLNRVSSRESIEFSCWYDLFYGSKSGLSAQKVQIVIQAIANAIGVQATQLRPTDRLDHELSIPEAGSLDDTIEVIQEYLCECFNEDIIIRKNWNTIDDIVRGVAPIIK